MFYIGPRGGLMQKLEVPHRCWPANKNSVLFFISISCLHGRVENCRILAWIIWDTVPHPPLLLADSICHIFCSSDIIKGLALICGGFFRYRLVATPRHVLPRPDFERKRSSSVFHFNHRRLCILGTSTLQTDTRKMILRSKEIGRVMAT